MFVMSLQRQTSGSYRHEQVCCGEWELGNQGLGDYGAYPVIVEVGWVLRGCAYLQFRRCANIGTNLVVLVRALCCRLTFHAGHRQLEGEWWQPSGYFRSLGSLFPTGTPIDHTALPGDCRCPSGAPMGRQWNPFN